MLPVQTLEKLRDLRAEIRGYEAAGDAENAAKSQAEYVRLAMESGMIDSSCDDEEIDA